MKFHLGPLRIHQPPRLGASTFFYWRGSRIAIWHHRALYRLRKAL